MGTKVSTMVDEALFAAIEAGDDSAVCSALARGADPNASNSRGWPALLRAARLGRLGAVRALITYGVNLDVRSDGESALLLATYGGHVAVVKLLLEHGADVNHHGGEGDFPLKTAAEAGNLELCKLFLDAGADLEDAGGINGLSALGMAAGMGHVEVVKLLLERGADPEKEDLGYSTARVHAGVMASIEPSEQRFEVLRILDEAIEAKHRK